MKLLFLIVTLSYSSFLLADIADFEKTKKNYQIYQIDNDSDIKSLSAHKNHLKKNNRTKLMTTTKRDALLTQYLYKGKVESLDDLERDLIVKSILYYKEEQFFKKYKQYISKDNYSKLKVELNGVSND